MGFVLLGVLLLLLKLGGWASFSDSEFKSWLITLSPFGLAVLWWAWSDATGRTRRKAMQALDDKKEARRQEQMRALGRDDKRKR